MDIMIKVSIECPCGRQCRGIAYERPKGWICAACHKKQVREAKNLEAKKKRADLREAVAKLKSFI